MGRNFCGRDCIGEAQLVSRPLDLEIHFSYSVLRATLIDHGAPVPSLRNLPHRQYGGYVSATRAQQASPRS